MNTVHYMSNAFRLSIIFKRVSVAKTISKWTSHSESSQNYNDKTGNVSITQQCGAFGQCLYLLVYPNSPIPFLSKWALLGQFNVAGNNKTYSGLHIKFPKSLPDFKQIWNFTTDFHESPQYQISPKCGHWEPRHWGQKDRHDEAKRSCSPVCTPWRRMGEAEVWFHLFLTLIQVSFTPRKRYPWGRMHRRLRKFHSRLNDFGKKISPPVAARNIPS